MKILHVLNHFLPNRVAGIEVYVFHLSQQLINLGIDVVVVTPNYGSDLYNEYTYDNIIVKQYPEVSAPNRDLIFGIKKPNSLKSFQKILELESPDVVHFHEISGSNGILIDHIKVADKLICKKLMTFHLVNCSCPSGSLVINGVEECDGLVKLSKCTSCYLSHKGLTFGEDLVSLISILFYKLGINTARWNNKLGTALNSARYIRKKQDELRKIFTICDNVIVLTNWYKNVLRTNKLNENKIVYIPQSFSHPKNEFFKKNQVENQQIKILYLGRIAKVKGLHILLSAISKINKRLISLDIYGQIFDRDYTKELKAKYSSFENIQWHDSISPKDSCQLISSYDLLSVPSIIAEMSPNVIKEAFAVGVPVIASKLKGIEELIQHGKTGLLFDLNNAESLKNEILKCIQNPEFLEVLRRNIGEHKGNSVNIALRHIELYNNLISF